MRCHCAATSSWRNAPVLSADDLSLVLTCWFALDIFTINQQDCPDAPDDHIPLWPETRKPQSATRVLGHQPVQRAPPLRPS